MIAVGGTSWNGTQYHYYKCKNKDCQKLAKRKDYLEWFVTQHVLDLLNMESKKETLADRVITAYKSSMETDRVAEIEKELRAVSDKHNHVIDLLIKHKTDALLEKMDNLELRKSELEEQLYSARLAQKHIPSRKEIVEWFAKLQAVDECKSSLQRQVIQTFVHKVYLWDEKAVIVLTLANTQETVAFEHIRDWEMAGYPEFGITSLIPKKRISRKTETNGIGKGKDFGKFGIKF